MENGGISEDGLTYTFKLRDDAKWHDGEPLTAADVVFSHNLIMNPDFVAGTKIGHDKVAEISAPDDHTVKMTLSEPYAPFLASLTGTSVSIVPGAEVESGAREGCGAAGRACGSKLVLSGVLQCSRAR